MLLYFIITLHLNFIFGAIFTTTYAVAEFVHALMVIVVNGGSGVVGVVICGDVKCSSSEKL